MCVPSKRCVCAHAVWHCFVREAIEMIGTQENTAFRWKSLLITAILRWHFCILKGGKSVEMEKRSASVDMISLILPLNTVHTIPFQSSHDKTEQAQGFPVWRQKIAQMSWHKSFIEISFQILRVTSQMSCLHCLPWYFTLTLFLLLSHFSRVRLCVTP